MTSPLASLQSPQDTSHWTMAGADEAELKEVVFFTGSCVYVYTREIIIISLVYTVYYF